MKILNKMNKEQRAQDLEQEEFMIIDMKAHVSKIKKLDFIWKKKRKNMVPSLLVLQSKQM